LSSIPWDTIQNGARNVASAIGQGINGFVDGLDWSLLGSMIGNGINTAFIFVNTFLTTINWGNIGTAIADFLNSGIETIDWSLIGTTIANKFNAGIDFAYNFVTKINWKNFGISISKGINGIIQNINFKKLAQGINNGVADKIQNIIQKVQDTIDAGIENKIKEWTAGMYKYEAKGVGNTIINKTVNVEQNNTITTPVDSPSVAYKKQETLNRNLANEIAYVF